ncbi:hypothetical protein THARTR1_03795 [Trichoderma harzianum]|uniref:Annexin n=1 Tax=Trichoderma harzianum TaxID=5544 RepID=A0A2K0UEP6_TRIHA|nr:hypothetical protein THARTR1_03795 [Trichoderma harzianum]
MNYNSGQFGQTTGHQNQQWPNSPLPPNPNSTPGLNQSYYDSGPLPPAAQHHHPHPFLSAPPTHQYPAQITPNYGAVPPGQYAQNAPQPPYGQQPGGSQQYPQQYSQQYTQQQPIYTQNADVTSQPQSNLQWQLQQRPRDASVPEEQQYKIYVLPTPASPGYDGSQPDYMQHINTTADVNLLISAMRGGGRMYTALIRVLANPKYQDPWALHQLRTNYYSRTRLNLAEQIEQKSQGFFQVALTALFMSPLNYDVYTLQRALSSDVTDVEALNDVLLCRSNADIRAIVNKYKSIKGDDLAQLIESKVETSLFHLYSPILSGTRAENTVPAIYAEVEYEVLKICQIGNPPSIDTTPIVDILASANTAQLRAISSFYEMKYQRILYDDISQKFCGCTEKNGLLRILAFATDSGKSDEARLWDALGQSTRDYSIFTYRALRLYWSGIGALQELHDASMKSDGKLIKTQLDHKLPDGDYRDLMIALIGEKSKPKPR